MVLSLVLLLDNTEVRHNSTLDRSVVRISWSVSAQNLRMTMIRMKLKIPSS